MTSPSPALSAPSLPLPFASHARHPGRRPAVPALALVLTLTTALLTLRPDPAHAQFQGTASRSTTTYPSSTQIGGASVTYDQETRKLIVVADEETASYISQVVTNIDRAAPQVLIKVVFLEVTYRKGFDFGIEGAYVKNMGNSSTGSINQVFGLARQGTFPAPPGAGMYQILTDDFQVTIRAIAEAGKSEVLSRPSVLARNNQQAVITVGQEVPLINGVRYDNFGNQINSIEYRDVGIILTVTPFITSDNLIEMIVSPTISNLSEETVPIADGVEAPIINTRSADTVVVTPDGQTVIIGGLMQTLGAQTDSKIPWLGDIPLLGSLFKRRSDSKAQTELLIFLTPHIVRAPSQLAGVAHRERAQQVITPQSFPDEELDRFLNGLPKKQEVPTKEESRKRRRKEASGSTR